MQVSKLEEAMNDIASASNGTPFAALHFVAYWHSATDWPVAIAVDIVGTTDIGQSVQNDVLIQRRCLSGEVHEAAEFADPSGREVTLLDHFIGRGERY
jgi:hypothetical protein